MLVRKLLLAAAVIGILGITGKAFAQSEAEKPKTLVDRLDAFGKSIFGGILPAKKPIPKPSETPQKSESPQKDTRLVSRGSMLPETSEEEPAAPRAGSILAKPNPGPSANHDPTLSMDEFMPENTLPAVRRQVVETPRPTTRLLHERLSGFRKSAFDSDAEDNSSERAGIPPERASDAVAQKVEGDSDLNSPYSESRPIVAQRVVPAVRAGAPRPAQPIYDIENDRSVAVESRPAAVGNSRSAESPASDGVLFARKGPILSVETMGPRTITVGRGSTYQVNLMNSGEVAAEDLVVHVMLPAWAEVAGIEASLGDARPPEATHAGAIDWKVGHLDGKSRQRLTIRIVPRQSRPFDLAVRWEYKPIASQAMIEVQEPKLSLQLDGPREVFYGKKELYRLKLANKGTGNAENVRIVMTPVGAGENVSASHKVGLLAAGDEKSLDVELTARQGGLLTIQAEARADGGLRAELLEKILVHRAGLKLDIAGPKVQFVGAVATYSVRVCNSGTAPARNVNFSIALPAGAKYLSGIDGARLDAAEKKLVWSLETLAPDVERSFTIKCRMATVGTSRVRLSATAADDVVASAETSVQVETVVNLTMDVKDPTGPVPVGEEAVYEVRVRNRGTKEAQNIEVFAYFSRGIEPTAAEGAPNRLAAGQVVFQPIASLAPGEEAVLKVRAKAEVAGNHVFRAEARCKLLNARLVSEATNLYYTDAPAATNTEKDSSATNTPAPEDDGVQAIPQSIHDDLTPLPPQE